MLISLRLPPGSFSVLLCPALCPRWLIFLDGITWVLGFLVRFGEQKMLAENGSVGGGCEQAFFLLFPSCFVFLSVFSSVTYSSSGLALQSTLYFSSFCRPTGDILVSLAGHVTLCTPLQSVSSLKSFFKTLAEFSFCPCQIMMDTESTVSLYQCYFGFGAI